VSSSRELGCGELAEGTGLFADPARFATSSHEPEPLLIERFEHLLKILVRADCSGKADVTG
jgi:hypothetical protein